MTTTKQWCLDVKEHSDGDKYIELNQEILELSGFKEGDKLLWVDNLDSSFTILQYDNIKDSYTLTCEMSIDNRSILLYIANDNPDVYLLIMYEANDIASARMFKDKTSNYVNDCAENWLHRYGEFKNENIDTK
jgi:hypothetical protein